MGMFLGSIKSLAGDCEKTHRWCLVNLTGDDANDTDRQKLTQLRVTKVGRKFVRALEPRTANPYASCTWDYDQWFAGWDDEMDG